MVMNNVSISNEIREVCRSLHISIAELARRTGQSPQNLNSKLNRESFTMDELDAIAASLGIKFERRFVFPKDYN